MHQTYRSPIQSESYLSNRVSRAKPHLGWEQIDRESGGIYDIYLRDLAVRFPMLSPTELRICSLVRGMLSNWEISQCLNICVETVQNHRVNIRKKLGLGVSDNLMRRLLT